MICYDKLLLLLVNLMCKFLGLMSWLRIYDIYLAEVWRRPHGAKFKHVRWLSLICYAIAIHIWGWHQQGWGSRFSFRYHHSPCDSFWCCSCTQSFNFSRFRPISIARNCIRGAIINLYRKKCHTKNRSLLFVFHFWGYSKDTTKIE